MSERVKQIHQRLAARPDRPQRETKQDRDQQDFENVSFGEGIHYRGRNDVHEKLGHALRFRLTRIIRDGLAVERSRVHVEAAAGVNHVAYDKADQQRERGYSFEVEESFAADATDLLHVLHAGDAGDHGAEDDESDDHRDQADEGVAERLHGDGFGWAEVSKRQCHGDGQEHLYP